MTKNLTAIIAETGAINAVESINNNGADILKKFISNVPSETQLRRIYDYGVKLAFTFASDGELFDVNFYIDYEKTKMSKRAQLFIFSQNRGETLTTYIPSRHSNTTEGRPIHVLNQKTKAINSYSHWREATILSIENNAKDFDKADTIQLQISPNESSLSLTFYYYRDKHHWRHCYSLEGSKLLKGDQEITDFSA
jgi:hypothetical protein